MNLPKPMPKKMSSRLKFVKSCRKSDDDDDDKSTLIMLIGDIIERLSEEAEADATKRALCAKADAI